MYKPLAVIVLLVLGAVACGGAESPRPRAAPTVFDPLLQKKTAIPAAVEAAQRQRDAEAQQLDAPDRAPPTEPRR